MTEQQIGNEMTIVGTAGHDLERARKAPFRYLVGMTVFLGAALRLWSLGTESYWFDEVYTVIFAQERISTILQYRAPVYVVFAHYWTALAGTTEGAGRLFPALLSIASLLILYLIGRELFNRRVALIAVFFMSVSEFQIYYAQDFRFYSLFLLLTLLSFWFYIRGLEYGKWTDSLLYILTGFLMYHTQTIAVLVLAAQALHFLLFWQRHRRVSWRWLASKVVLFTALAPGLLPDILGKAEHTANTQLSWIPQRPLWYLIRTFYWYVFPLRYERSWQSMTLSFAAGAGLFAIGMIAFVRRQRIGPWLSEFARLPQQVRQLREQSESLFLTLGWALLPSAGLYLLSQILTPVYVDRYTIPATPAVYLLLGVLVNLVSRIVPTRVILGALAIIVAPGLQYYYAADVKEQWREAAQYVQENTQKEDLLFFAPNEGGEAFEAMATREYGWQQKVFQWYYGGDLPACHHRMDYVTPELVSQGLQACTTDVDAFWLVVRGPEHKVKVVNDFFFNQEHPNLRLLSERQFVGIGVYSFALEP